jgi:cell division septum initiation protein DivIVA
MVDPLEPPEIARRDFEIVRRGYDQNAVRAFLHEVSALLNRALAAETDLTTRLHRAEAKAEAAEHPDEAAMLLALGEETTRVLTSAREAAADIRTKAEDAAARIIAEATAQGAQTRSQAVAEADKRMSEARAEAEKILTAARSELERRTKEAAEAADRIKAEGTQAVQAARDEAQRLLKAANDQATAVVEGAKEQGKELLADAQAARERVLRDLTAKRKKARQQIEQLNAGRERLLQAYDVVRGTIDEATNELSSSVTDARVAAAAAARRVAAEPDPTAKELDDEIAAAPLEELPIVVTTVRPPAEPPAPPRARAAGSDFDPMPTPSRAKSRPTPALDLELELEPAAPPAPVAAAPQPEPEPEPVAAVEPDPAPMPEPVVAVAPEPAPEPEPVAAVEPEPELVVEPEPELVVEPEPVAVVEPEPEPEPEPEVSEPEPAPESAHEQAFAARGAALEDVERDLGKRLKRTLADEQNEVLDNLRRGKPGGVEDLLPTADDHAARWGDAAAGPLQKAATAGADWVGGKATPIADLADELARGLVLPLRERIERSFVASDGNLDDVSDRVRALYREWKIQRLGEAAAHFAAAAHARGLFDAMPSDAKVQWVPEPGRGACPDCDDNVLAGAIAKGDEFPTGDRCAPAHPGCRCLVLVVDAT